MRGEQGRFREELGLSTPGLHADTLVTCALEAGFHRAGVVDPALLAPWAAKLRGLGGPGPSGIEWDWVLDPSRWSRSSTLLVCCLSCHSNEPDDLSTPGDPHGLIAPFARANFYRAAMDRLRSLARRISEGHGVRRQAIRLFANSRLPEKALLAGAGIGTYGKNGLAIVPGLGSLFVIGGAVLPVPSAAPRFPARPAADPCGSCMACLKACPVGAITAPGVVDADLCLQGAAGAAGEMAPVMMEKWGARLYGCQVCQDACPHNRGVSAGCRDAPGAIGPSLSLRWILSHDAGSLKEALRGSALGMSWISGEALLRNALVAAGNRGDRPLRADVERFARCEAPVLRRTAQWALERMRNATGYGL